MRAYGRPAMSEFDPQSDAQAYLLLLEQCMLVAPERVAELFSHLFLMSPSVSELAGERFIVEAIPADEQAATPRWRYRIWGADSGELYRHWQVDFTGFHEMESGFPETLTASLRIALNGIGRTSDEEMTAFLELGAMLEASSRA